MSVINTNDGIGLNSRGYLKIIKWFNTGPIRLLFIFVFLNYYISAHAQLVDSVKFYDIKGKTTKEFVQNFFRIQNAQGFRGYCWWKPIMKHSHIQTPLGFKASNLNLKVNVTLVLPRPFYPKNMPTMTRYDFEKRIKFTYEHEYTHRAFKIQFYNNFVRDFNRLPAMPTVDGVYLAANRLLWKHYNQTKANDALFDKNDRSGRHLPMSKLSEQQRNTRKALDKRILR